jgi:hypothetical protein
MAVSRMFSEALWARSERMTGKPDPALVLSEES